MVIHADKDDLGQVLPSLSFGVLSTNLLIFTDCSQFAGRSRALQVNRERWRTRSLWRDRHCQVVLIRHAFIVTWFLLWLSPDFGFDCHQIFKFKGLDHQSWRMLEILRAFELILCPFQPNSKNSGELWGSSDFQMLNDTCLNCHLKVNNQLHYTRNFKLHSGFRHFWSIIVVHIRQ